MTWKGKQTCLEGVKTTGGVGGGGGRKWGWGIVPNMVKSILVGESLG